MTRSKWMHVGDILKMNAFNHPVKLGWQDKNREFTFLEWNDRACRFSNGLKDLGVGYKDAFAVLCLQPRVSGWISLPGAPKGGRWWCPSCFDLAGP